MLADYQEQSKLQKGRKFFKYYLIVALIIVVFLAGFFIGKNTDQAIFDIAQSGEVYNKEEIPGFLTKDIDFDLFWNVNIFIEVPLLIFECVVR